jgi:hypothetical protein
VAHKSEHSMKDMADPAYVQRVTDQMMKDEARAAVKRQSGRDWTQDPIRGMDAYKDLKR